MRFALREGERADDLNRASPGSGPSETARDALASPTDPGLLQALRPGTKEDPAAPAIWSGVVRARDGSPIKGAVVRFRYRSLERVGDDSFVEASEWFTLTTGADGLIALLYKAGSVIDIEVTAPGYGKEKFGVEGQASQDLTLDRASSIEGRVMSKDGRTPMAGATVCFENENERYWVETDADGRFRFDGVGAHTARVQVYDNRFMAQSQAIDYLMPGIASSMNDLLVEAGYWLNGEVVNAGSMGPMPGSYVELIDRMTGALVSTGITDGLGRFSFHSLNPFRQYVVTAYGLGYRYDTPPLSFGSDSQIQLPVNPTWTLGVVVHDASGAAAAGAQVTLKRQDMLPIAGNDFGIISTTNGQGLLAFGGLSPNLVYKVLISKPGSATLEIGSISSAWNGTLPLVVSLPEGRQLLGRVLDEEGNPVGGVTVRAQRTDSVPAPALFVMTDALGNFAFDYLAPGEVSLVTFKSGYDNSRIVMEVPEAGSDALVNITIPLLNVLPIQR